MFIDHLLNEGATPFLEQTIRFTAARHKYLAEDVVNISTPNFKPRDLSLEKFQQMLAQHAAIADRSGPGAVDFSDIQNVPIESHHGILFHDGQQRSMEQLMSDQAKNALMHNVAIELLRHQFQIMQMALKGQP